MEYDFKDAGKVSECGRCHARFRIPGGTTDKLSNALAKELSAKLVKPRERIEDSSTPARPINIITESIVEQGLFHKPAIRADHESLGIGRWVAGVVAVFFLFVLGGVLLMITTGQMNLPNNWNNPFQEVAEGPKNPDAENPIPPNRAKGVPDRPVIADGGIRADAGNTPIAPMRDFQQPKFQFRRIGANPPTLDVKIPPEILSPMKMNPLTQAEVKSLTEKVVAAINTNSSQQLVALMDPEITGNYLFAHAELSAAEKYQYGAEALDLYQCNPLLSNQLPWAKQFTSVRLGSMQSVLIRTSNNARVDKERISPPNRSSFGPPRDDSTNLDPQLASIVNEFDRYREQIDRKLPERIRGSSFPGGSSEPLTQMSPLNTLIDHPMLYFAVIGGRNRAGTPVLLDLACLNYDGCLLDGTWNTIDADSQSKAFSCRRPANQTEKYIQLFQREVGEKTLQDIYKANFAFDQIRALTKSHSGSMPKFLAETKMAEPSPDDCLDSLEDLEVFFPDDPFNVMVRYFVSNKAEFKDDAKKQFDRAAALGCPNVDFYEDAMRPFRFGGDPAEARKILDAFRKNCRR